MKDVEDREKWRRGDVDTRYSCDRTPRKSEDSVRGGIGESPVRVAKFAVAYSWLGVEEGAIEN